MMKLAAIPPVIFADLNGFHERLATDGDAPLTFGERQIIGRAVMALVQMRSEMRLTMTDVIDHIESGHIDHALALLKACADLCAEKENA